MKPYQPIQHISPFGIITLCAGSVVIGTAVGALAYLISHLFYLIFLFPLGMGLVGGIAYTRLILFAKARHSLIIAGFGVVTGIIIALAFYGASYLSWRNQVIAEIQKSYEIDRGQAGYVFGEFLKEETGLGGLLGFMALRAREGEGFTNYLMVHQIPVFQFSFTLKSIWAWLYWLAEMILITAPTAWLSHAISQKPFNQSVNDWYDSLPKQFGLVPGDCKDAFLQLWKSGCFPETSELVFQEADGPAPHPLLELYEQHSLKHEGDFLITLKETRREDSTKVKRSDLGRWELTRQEFQRYTASLPDTKIKTDYLYPDEYY